MTTPVVGQYNTETLVTRFLHNATTSRYYLSFIPPGGVVEHLRVNKGIIWADMSEKINLRCISAKLPGSSLATHDVTSDFLGVTEKMAYRRIYEDTFSVTMLVDYEYKILHFFEGWMDYIVGKNDQRTGTAPADNDTYNNYRVGTRLNYPNGNAGYRSNSIELVKFDRDNDNTIKYKFIEGFPASMDSMEISYDGTDLLRLNVNFKFVRYNTEPFVDREGTSTRERFYDQFFLDLNN